LGFLAANDQGKVNSQEGKGVEERKAVEKIETKTGRSSTNTRITGNRPVVFLVQKIVLRQGSGTGGKKKGEKGERNFWFRLAKRNKMFDR